MDSAYFLIMLIGITWLAVWSVLPRPYKGKGWWPFDMRPDAAGTDTAEPADGSGRGNPNCPKARRWLARPCGC